MSAQKKLVIVLGENANDDRSSVAFTIASAALSSRMVVTGAGPLIEWVRAGAVRRSACRSERWR